MMNENAQSRGGESEARVDRTLALLKDSTASETRFTVLQEVVRYWHGPIKDEDGLTGDELKGLPLPEPLLKWYRWAGRRSEIMSGQNFLFSPRERQYDFRKLRLDGDRLLFQIENQGVYEWATLPEGEDPPVFGRYNGESWEREAVSLSEHLILTCLFEAILCHAPYAASNAWIKPDQLNAITESLELVAIPPWRWPGATRFYAGRGAFLCASDCKIRGAAGSSIWIGAKNRDSLRSLSEHVDQTWGHVDLD
jgi:hypothetical protein